MVSTADEDDREDDFEEEEVQPAVEGNEDEEEEEEEEEEAVKASSESVLTIENGTLYTDRIEKMELQMKTILEQMTVVTSFIDNWDGRSKVVTGSTKSKTVYTFSETQILNVGVLVRKHVFKNVKFWVSGIMKITAGPIILKKTLKKLGITDEEIQEGIQGDLIKHVKHFLASHRGNVIREIKLAFFGKKNISINTPKQQNLTLYLFQQTFSATWTESS